MNVDVEFVTYFLPLRTQLETALGKFKIVKKLYSVLSFPSSLELSSLLRFSPKNGMSSSIYNIMNVVNIML